MRFHKCRARRTTDRRRRVAGSHGVNRCSGSKTQPITRYSSRFPTHPRLPTQDLRAPNGPRAATVGLYDHEQWPDGPFACDFVLVTEDLSRASRAVR